MLAFLRRQARTRGVPAGRRRLPPRPSTPQSGRSGGIFGDFAAPLQAQPIHEIEPNIVGQHVAYGAKVSRIEACRIFEQARALGRRQRGR
jgi:hypothetical protein